MNLEHDLANCTGRWRPEAIGNRLRFRCDRCGSITHRSDAVDEAAALENQLGTVLRHLADAGQRLLDREGRSG